MLKKKVTDFFSMYEDHMILTALLFTIIWVVSIPFITVVKVIWKGGADK